MNAPIFYYPTTIVFVDDDNLFLKAISNVVPYHYKAQTFSDPFKCLEMIKKTNSVLTTNLVHLEHVNHDHQDTVNSTLLNVDFPSLYDIKKHNTRHDQISIIVADYNMPEINGINFFKELANFPFKKILLTGEASYEEAISAFNNNIIDHFIRKDISSLAEELEARLLTLSNKFFAERTLHLFPHLNNYGKTILSDSVFFDFLESICKEKEIVEFMVIDKNGYFLLIDSSRKEYILTIQTDNFLDEFVQQNNEDLSAQLSLDKIKARKKIPFFGIGREPWEIEGKYWNQFLYSPSELLGIEKYYYSIIQQ